MFSLAFSKIKDLLFSFRNIPTLNKLEYSITQDCYFTSVHTTNLYDSLFTTGIIPDEDKDDYNSINHKLSEIKNIFSQLSLKSKIKKIKSINSYIDQSTFFEDFTMSSNEKRNMMVRYIILYYAESTIRMLSCQEKPTFIKYVSTLLEYFPSQNELIYEKKMISYWILETAIPSKSNDEQIHLPLKI